MAKTALIILDGWGHGDKTKSDAIFNANTPFIDGLHKNTPNAELRTDGENVGLPKGQMGNSEVGHLNIGAGRIVYQELTRINKSIEEGAFFENPILKSAFEKAKKENKKVHLIGLVSKGGVHSSQEHLYALCNMAHAHQLEKVFIHAFTDGRDCDPKSGLGYLQELEKNIKDKPIKIASIIGRYYAMDRDKRWGRIQLAYDLLVHSKGKKYDSVTNALQESYQDGKTDEFIQPITLGIDNSNIEKDDIVICFNFRTDRCREITMALTQLAFPDYNMKPLQLDYITMTEYDASYENVKVVFENDNLEQTLGETISQAGRNQVRIAETEKYPHVTFFFNGGLESPFEGEKRLMVNSPKVATYDLQPEMSAHEVTDICLKEMEENLPDFICLNFANPDMVGHTGDYEAIIKAVETVDQCASKIVNLGQKLGYSFIIIADHGNADHALNKDGTPNTAHSLNPVPVIVLDPKVTRVSNGILADVAPTICSLMNIQQPEKMTGKSLISFDA